MLYNISEFKLADAILRRLSHKASVPYYDYLISFSDDNKNIKNISLNINNPKNIIHTIYLIVESYIKNCNKKLFSSTKEETEFLLMLATSLKQLSFDPLVFPESKMEGYNISRLYQKTFIWLVLKDIIGPVFDRDVKNIKIVSGSSPFVDISFYVDTEDLSEPYIFVNTDIDNSIVKNLFLLMSAIQSVDLCPYATLKSVLESNIFYKFEGLVKLAFKKDEHIDMFLSLLADMLHLNIKDFSHINISDSGNIVKIAQSSGWDPGTWWHIGIIEKMLEPVRGSDWSTYMSLEGYIDDFWKKVKEYRMKHNPKEGVAFDTLLRLKSEGLETDANKTLQELLASDRIW